MVLHQRKKEDGEQDRCSAGGELHKAGRKSELHREFLRRVSSADWTAATGATEEKVRASSGFAPVLITSGKHWKELPDDYMVPTKGDEPFANCIIVGGGEEEHCEIIDGGRGTACSIDAWR